MKRRLFCALLFVAFAGGLCTGATISHAAPIYELALAPAPHEAPFLTKIEYGCGWDYPCPPRPSYGRRSYRTPQVYIENNYGTVNIHPSGGRYRYDNPYPRRWREGRYEEWDDNRRCEGDYCGEGCGLFCWYRRIRHGYCGHGCDVYREQAYERDYRDSACSRPDCRRPSPEEYYRYDPRERYDSHARFERPGGDERVPLGRFYGPKYPQD